MNRKPFDVSTKVTLEGGAEVVLYSKKQQEMFDSLTIADTEIRKSKIVKQFTSGEIVIHKFYNVDGKWYGYAAVIGIRGGKQTTPYRVYENKDELTLIV